MAKTFDPSQFPQPPKQTFPAEIVPPSPPSIGSGWKNEAPDFKSAFLKFMQEAGEVLGQAAKTEIEKATISVSAGDQSSGSSGGRRPGAQSFTKRMFNDAMDRLRSSGPQGARMATIVQGAIAVASLIKEVPEMAGHHADAQRRFANVSPEMAGVFIQSDQRRMFRDMTSGANLAPSNRGLLKELDKFRDSAAQVTDKVTEIKNVLYENILGVMNQLAGPAIEYFLGARKQIEMQPWVGKLQDLADLDKADRAAAAAKAKAGMEPIQKGMNIAWMNGQPVWQPKDPNFIGPPAPLGLRGK